MEHIEKMKKIQNYILEYLDNEEDEVQNFDEISKLLNFQINQPDIQEFKSILYLISKISKNHYRKPFFFNKIKKIIIMLKNEIKQTFSNIEIYNIFEKNKRVILILFDEDIITVDSNILFKISKYEDYFYPEINKFKKEENIKELPEYYNEKRRIGENDSIICEIIRKDDIDEFTIYYTKKGQSLPNLQITPSRYETNSFLLNKQPTLAEYSAFYGSIQILRFLHLNKVELTPSLWLYAIHGHNPEVIHFLEENQIKPQDERYKECLKESIKCHHNDFAFYFKNNFINEDCPGYIDNEIYYGFHYYNFEFVPNELKEKYCFYYAIEYGDLKVLS